MKYIDINKGLPESPHQLDIDVLVRITGLAMNASPYEEYRVLKFRPKMNCFIEWEYNSKGEMSAKTYNHENSNKYDCVTHWAYLKKVPDSQIKD